jgi:hypothetical protein
MKKIRINPYNVLNGKKLPDLQVDKIPEQGDPLEIDNELYFVCEIDKNRTEDRPSFGLIPLVVRDPAKVKNIGDYIKCLTIAHRRVQFVNDKGTCDFESCNEMRISK